MKKKQRMIKEVKIVYKIEMKIKRKQQIDKTL